MIHMTKRHLSGLRMSVAIGIILPVAAEMIGPELGVGAYILLPGCLAATEKKFNAIVAILFAIVLTITWDLGKQKPFLCWQR